MHIINLCLSVTSVCPYLFHTELTELTENLSLPSDATYGSNLSNSSNISNLSFISVLSVLSVCLYTDPLIIRVYRWHLCGI